MPRQLSPAIFAFASHFRRQLMLPLRLSLLLLRLLILHSQIFLLQLQSAFSAFVSQLFAASRFHCTADSRQLLVGFRHY